METENDLKVYMFLEAWEGRAGSTYEYLNGRSELVVRLKSRLNFGSITVHPKLEYVSDQWCHVVELVASAKHRTDEGKIEEGQTKQLFWMAHDKGMCLMRYQKYSYNKMQKEIEVEQISSADMDGTIIWYPVKARMTYESDYVGMIKDELTVKQFTPNIKVDDNTFRFDFPPGTDVYDRTRNISYTITSEQPKSLQGKSLPDISELATTGNMENNYQKKDNKLPKSTDKDSELNAIELLDKYAQNQDKLNSSVIVKFECEEKGFQDNKVDIDRSVPSEVRLDGQRCFGCVNHFYKKVNDQNVPLDEMDYRHFQMWDGERYMQYYDYGDDGSRGNIRLKNISEAFIQDAWPGSPLFGVRFHKAERIDTLLCRCKTISVRDNLEKIGSDDCYVIDAKDLFSTYTVWLNPKCGYSISKAVINIGPNSPGACYTVANNENISFTLTNVKFQQIGNIYVPMEYNTHWERYQAGFM